MHLHHDNFCRDILSDVSTFLEFIQYLASQNVALNKILKLLDTNSFIRIPGDYSDTASQGYADLAFVAKVRKEILDKYKQAAATNAPVEVCVGFLLEHKSAPDNGVMAQLIRYHYHLMCRRMQNNAREGIPSVAIILYNGRDMWNPLVQYENMPPELSPLSLPFKCIMVNVNDIPDEKCKTFGTRLAAFISALKYVRDPESHRSVFKDIVDRIQTSLNQDERLDLMHSIDVYLQGWLSNNFKEAFNMDFVRAPYKTIADGFYEDGLNAGINVGMKTSLDIINALNRCESIEDIARKFKVSLDIVKQIQQSIGK